VAGLAGGVFAAPDPEDVERQQTGGLTYDEMTQFAALAAERGLSTVDGSLDATAAEALLSDLGYTVENIDTFMNSINNLGASFDELANDAYAAAETERARVDATAASIAQTSEAV
jgi:hypothetical protein